MKVLTGGCSFTAHSIESNLAWPFHMSHDITNTAEMASGNMIILDRIISKLDNTFDYCVVMWSSPYRVEFLLNNELSDYSNIIEKMKDTNAISNYQLTGIPHAIEPSSNWLRVGGGYGIWKFDVDEIDDILEYYFKWIHNLEYQFIQTLKNIILLQNYCKVNGIKLINTCWNNIFDIVKEADDRASGSNKFVTKESMQLLEKGDFKQYPIIDWYPNARQWYDKIDWSNWLFYENEYVKRGGLGEYAIIECNDGFKRGAHPSSDSQKSWASFVEKRIV